VPVSLEVVVSGPVCLAAAGLRGLAAAGLFGDGALATAGAGAGVVSRTPVAVDSWIATGAVSPTRADVVSRGGLLVVSAAVPDWRSRPQPATTDSRRTATAV